MTMKELANLMLRLGCMEALNLDVGGSSTMVIDGIVVNEPCGKMQENGKHVEAVSDAILIFPCSYKKKRIMKGAKIVVTAMTRIMEAYKS